MIDPAVELGEATSVGRRTWPVVACAAAWAAPVAGRLWRAPSSWWIARDDGVITLSHARNLVDFGTIGVSPGGDRVEGFSSPLHVALAALIDVFADPGAMAMSMAVLVVGLVVSAAALGYGIDRRLRSIGVDDPRWTVAVGAVAGLLTALPWTTAGWIGSGMENPVILAAGACVAGGVLAGLDTPLSRALAAVGLAAFLVSRVEFAALGVPVLVAVALAAAHGHRPTRREVVTLLAVPMAAVGVVHLARRWYFGAWLPNTAIVQDRGAGATQVVVIAVVATGAAALLVRAALAGGHRSGSADGVRRATTAALAASVLVLLWLDATGRTGAAPGAVLQVPGVVPITLAAAVAVGVRTWSNHDVDLTHHGVLWALALVPLAQLVVTGPARLDDHRVAGVAVPFVAVSAALAAAELVHDRRVDLGGRIPAAGLAVVLVAAATVGAWRSDRVEPLNYEVGWAGEVVAVVDEVRTGSLASTALVITANPDLGKVSYAKHSVMVDLGWLGDPLMATLRSEHPDLLDAYLGRIAVPDVVSSHSGWSCEYRGWLESPAFVAGYRLHGDPDASWVRPGDACPLDGLRGVWVRADGEAEYALTRELVGADDPVAAVTAALEACRSSAGDRLRCQPVRRAVQRVAHELRDDGTFDPVVDAFATSPSAAFDRAVLERRPGWWEPAAGEVADLLGDRG